MEESRGNSDHVSSSSICADCYINLHQIPMESINVFGSPTSTEASSRRGYNGIEFQLIRIDLYSGLQRALLTFEDGGTTVVGEIH
ncbi:hypothetical protein QJS10_CPA03g02351 [Acorus calamus]|uniref:Uncharacterized protein n=1 Tax=Acorus calamus TaxID=4465 RepID=A0AAV9F6F3_ACOCL|nr:hypothetical protein QJS10_CPA03g02351 [Acorus calamus]